jgi:hypothetical protein
MDEYPNFNNRKKEFQDRVRKVRQQKLRNLIAIILLALAILTPIIIEWVK